MRGRGRSRDQEGGNYDSPSKRLVGAEVEEMLKFETYFE